MVLIHGLNISAFEKGKEQICDKKLWELVKNTGEMRMWDKSLFSISRVSPGQNGHERKDKWKILKWDDYRENVFLNIMESMKTRKEVW